MMRAFLMTMDMTFPYMILKGMKRAGCRPRGAPLTHPEEGCARVVAAEVAGRRKAACGGEAEAFAGGDLLARNRRAQPCAVPVGPVAGDGAERAAAPAAAVAVDDPHDADGVRAECRAERLVERVFSLRAGERGMGDIDGHDSGHGRWGRTMRAAVRCQ